MTLGDFLKSIFSISDYGETHHILRICGLKIKFAKREYVLKKKESVYYYYKNNNIDITTIPPAEGQMRDIQLANLELLKEFNRVCRKENIDYWLDYGSALGAVRHKGYIPWDDDIDIGMIREDYEKIIDIFNRSTINDKLVAEYNRNPNNSVIIKIKHRDSQYVFIDIFPFDLCSKELVGKNPIKTTSKIKKLCKKLQKEHKNSTLEELLKAYGKLRESVLGSVKGTDNSYLVRGLDFCGFPKDWFYKYDTVYPLTKIEFEGGEYNCMNNNDEFLRSMYGNYMTYPKKIGVGHTSCITIDDKDLEIIKNIAAEKELV